MGRCIKPSYFGKITNILLHNFSDASEIGYRECSYLRFVDENENIHCSLIMGKARLDPARFASILRLELIAVLLSVKIKYHTLSRKSYSCKNLMNISEHTVELCTLLMIQENSRPLLQIEFT